MRLVEIGIGIKMFSYGYIYIIQKIAPFGFCQFNGLEYFHKDYGRCQIGDKPNLI